MHLLQRQRRICRVRFPLYPGAAGAGQASGRRQGRAGRTLYRLFSGLYQYLCPGGGPAAAVCGRDPTAGGLRALHRHAAGLSAPEILSLLAELRAEKPVWVELGLQTIHASTAAYIRRGYPLSVYDEAVRALHARGISVITHQILGLPGETPEMMVETARYIGRSGAEGIKLHLLHVLTGTDLAADYAAGAFETLTLDAYITLLEACLRVLPREMVIHRLTGDGAKRDLLAPRWSGDKKRVINEIRRRFLADDLEQGSDLTDAPA